MSDKSFLLASVRHAFEVELEARRAVVEMLASRDRAGVVWPGSALLKQVAGVRYVQDTEDVLTGPRAVALANRVLMAVEYEWEDTPLSYNFSLQCPGIVCIAAEEVGVIHQFNAARETLAHAYKALGEGMTVFVDNQDGHRQQVSLRKSARHASRVGRWNPKQGTRALIVLDPSPQRISYAWTQFPRIYRTSVADVQQVLEGRLKGDEAHPALLEDLARIKHLAAYKPDTPLAKRLAGTPTLKANIALHDAEGRLTQKYQRYAALPLMIVSAQLPALITPPIWDQGQPPQIERRPRKPTTFQVGSTTRLRLHDEPFLKTLPIYEYHGT